MWRFLPLVAFLFVAALTVIWRVSDEPFFFWDAGVHILSAADFLADPAAYLTRAEQRYPPLGQVLLGVLLRLTRFDITTTILLFNISWLGLLMAAVHFLGRDLGPRVASLAPALLVCYPALLVQLRVPMLDLPFTALLSFAILALARCRGFEDRRFALAFGALLGLAQLTKHIAILFLAPIALFVLFMGNRSRRALWNVVAAVALSGAFALPWWVPRLTYYLKTWLRDQVAFADVHALSGVIGTFSVAGLAYYTLGLWYLTSFVFAALFMAALWRFAARPDRTLLTFVAVWAFTLISIIPTKDARYGTVVLPFVALVTAAGLESWRRMGLVASAALVFGAIQAWASSFGVSTLPAGQQVHAVTLQEPIQLFSQHMHMELGFHPDPRGWGLARPFGEIHGRVGILDVDPPPDNRFRLIFLADAFNLRHLAERATLPVSTSAAVVRCDDPVPLSRFDVLLVPIGIPDSPLEINARTAYCTAAFQETRRISLLRGRDRDMRDFLGIREIVVLERQSRADVQRLSGAPHPILSKEPGLSISAMDVLRAQAGVQRVGITVRNDSSQPREGRLFYVIAEAGRDPWREASFVSPTIPFRIGGGGSIFIELPGITFGPGDREMVAALHQMDESTLELVPRHSGGVRLGS